MADGVNEHVVVIDRQTLTPVTTFGDGGRYAGEFHGVHSIAIDSKGNLFTTETYEGRRIQKFIYKGMAPVTKMDQGVAVAQILTGRTLRFFMLLEIMRRQFALLLAALIFFAGPSASRTTFPSMRRCRCSSSPKATRPAGPGARAADDLYRRRISASRRRLCRSRQGRPFAARRRHRGPAGKSQTV